MFQSASRLMRAAPESRTFGPTRATSNIVGESSEHSTISPTRKVVDDSMALPLSGEIPETVLVAEDDAAILRLVRVILEEAGFEVLAASSAKEAIRVAAHFSRTIHLLLSDVMMPDMCGPSAPGRVPFLTNHPSAAFGCHDAGHVRAGVGGCVEATAARHAGDAYVRLCRWRYARS